MWHIFIDKHDGQYLVLHFDDNDVSDLLLLDQSNCWANNVLDYDTVDVDDDPCHMTSYEGLSIIHSFESDDPLTYIQSLPQTHPELFI